MSSRQEFESFTAPLSGDQINLDQDPLYEGTGDPEFVLNDLETAIPEGLPRPATYRMFIMPVGIKKRTKGGILLPDESIDAQMWLNCLGRVAALGPGCFKHPKFKDLGLTAEDFPKVGDIICYSARAPLRFGFRGARIIVINDDHWFANGITPEMTPYFRFYV